MYFLQYLFFCVWLISVFIPAVVCIRTSFLLVAEYYSIVCIYHILFILLLMDTWIVPTFWLLWIVLQWTLAYSTSLSPCFQFFWVYTGSGIAVSYGNSVFNFLGNCQTFPQGSQHFTFLPAVYEGSNFSTPLPCWGFFSSMFIRNIGLWFSFSIFVWLWYQDYADIIEWVRKCPLLFSFLEKLERDWY